MQKLSLSLLLLGMAANAGSETQNTSVGGNRYDWGGAYVGANLGVVWSGSELAANHVNFISDTGTYHNSTNQADVNPGLQFGYLHHLDNNWVLGGEADFSYPSSDSQFSVANTTGTAIDRFSIRNDLQGSLRIRAGYAFGRFLPFVTAGVSFGSMGLAYNGGDNAYAKTTTQTGWVLGSGVEYGFLDNLSARLEYLYTDYGNALNLGLPVVSGVTDPSGAAHSTLYTNVLRVAVNYRF